MRPLTLAGTAGVLSAGLEGREGALLIAIAIVLGLTVVVVAVLSATGSLRAIGGSNLGEFLSRTSITSLIAFVVGAVAGLAAYALNATGSQAIFAALAAALVAALFATAGTVIRPGEEEDNPALRWVGAMASGLTAGFLVVSLLATSALALDPGLPGSLANAMADVVNEQFSRAAFENELERLVLSGAAGTLFAALTVLLLRGVADSRRAARERRELEEELRRLRELVESQIGGRREPPE